MTEVLFYHLESSTLEQVLPGLLEKTLARGQRAAVRCGTPEGLEALDTHLWTYREDGFLPHAREDDPRPDEQPVLLTLGEAGNAADVLFLVEGAPVETGALSGFARAVVMFGPEGAEDARDAWRAVKGAGLTATYWKQTPQGRWEKAG
ncbi:DNA polymerase III subunit chi [Parvularcula oceani]|uniref:DNA polymerase III subunit chi n=1 Tax=Parvularcula oceani TaxID=1247963 RepID=UPI0004E0F3CD|nr:DNA polymerase III subunit chi [Parvularcula oceani]